MQRGGLPARIAPYVVKADGRLLARVDFAWPELKVAVEYDGLWHADERQFAAIDSGSISCTRPVGGWSS